MNHGSYASLPAQNVLPEYFAVRVDEALAPDDVFAPDEVLTPDDVLTPDEVLAPDDVFTPDDVLAPDDVVAPEDVGCPVGARDRQRRHADRLLTPDDSGGPGQRGAGDRGGPRENLRKGGGDRRVRPHRHRKPREPHRAFGVQLA